MEGVLSLERYQTTWVPILSFLLILCALGKALCSLDLSFLIHKKKRVDLVASVEDPLSTRQDHTGPGPQLCGLPSWEHISPE